MKKKFAVKALALLMTAAMAGSMLPVSLLAEQDTEAAEENIVLEDTEAAETVLTEDGSADSDTEETVSENTTAADITYTASFDGQVLSGIIKDSDSTYTYTDWNGNVTVTPLEIILIPDGAQTVDLTFSANALAYSYDADGNYLAGWYSGDDYMVGSDTASVIVDSNSDDTPDYVFVQTPYDSSWNSTLLYVITFEYEDSSDTSEITWTAASEGNALEEVSESTDCTYSYTDYYGNTTVVPMETLTIPEGTETVELSFSGNVLAYNYDADSTYLAGYYSDYMTGADTASVSVDSNNDGVLDYILVQTPYDADWNSTLLYVITFSYENKEVSDEPEENDEEIQDMYIATGKVQLNNLESDPASENNDASAADWEVLGLSRAGAEIPQETLDSYYQAIEDRLTENDGVLSSRRYTEYSRTILALTAAGYDPTDAAGYDLTEKLADYDAVSAQGLNGEIYALLALDCNDYTIPSAPEGKTQTTREQLVQDILDAQLPDGGWTLSGDSSDVDVTALSIQALARYYDSDENVKTAVDKAAEKLSELQNEDGSFNSSDDLKTSESSAQVITALCAIGIDPDSDSRFIKNGKSAVDALELFYINGQGFEHIQNGGLNTLATNQCYYALAAYHRFLNGQSALYDMRDVNAEPVAKDDPETGDEQKTENKSDDPETKDDSEAEDSSESEENSEIEDNSANKGNSVIAGSQESKDDSQSKQASENNDGKKNSSASDSAKSVKTGDDNALGLYLLLLFAACIASGILYRRKRA